MTSQQIIELGGTAQVVEFGGDVHVITIGIQGPSGAIDNSNLYMKSLIYDPRGIESDAFDLSNFTGKIDGGIFT